MVEVRKREGENGSALFFRFSKKVKRSGVLKEARKRRFHGRAVSRSRRRVSAIHKAGRRQEIDRMRKAGLL